MTFQWKIRYEVCRCMKSCSFHTLTASFIMFQWPPCQNTSKKWKTAGPHILNMQIADDMQFETILRAPTCSWIKFLVPLRLMHTWPSPGPAETCVFGGEGVVQMGFTQCFAICARLQRRLAARGVSMSLFQVEESSTLLGFGDSREADALQKSCFVWKWNDRPEYIDTKYVPPQIVFNCSFQDHD